MRATLSHVAYDDGLDWLPDRVVLTRPDLVELLPALRALVDALDSDAPAFAYVVTAATVLGRAMDRAGGSDDEGDER